MGYVIWLIIYLGLSILVASYAERRGRNGPGFFFLSLGISPILGFVFAYLNPGPTAVPSVPTPKCPFCAEKVRPEAIKCKHCGSDLPKRVSRAIEIPATIPSARSPR